MCPTACTASVWNHTRCFAATFAREGMSRIVPTTLLASMMLTRIVSGRIAASSCPGVILPIGSGFR